jgi:hypothetical protein
MSRKSNVHPDYYKTAGREPQGQAVIQEVERQKFREQEAFLEKQAGRRNLVPAANRVPTPEQNRSRDTTSGQDNNREGEHVNDQPKPSAEKKPARRIAGKPKASAEKKPARRVAGKAKASAEKKPARRAAGKARKRAPAPRAAKPKSKSQKQGSKRAGEKRPRPSARSGRK